MNQEISLTVRGTMAIVMEETFLEFSLEYSQELESAENGMSLNAPGTKIQDVFWRRPEIRWHKCMKKVYL